MSSMNTTENGMWEREKMVCEGKNGIALNLDSPGVVNAANYLPQFVARRYGEIVPVLTDSCRLNVKFSPKSNLIKYKYSVSWFEDGPIHKKMDSAAAKKCKKTERGDPKLDCPKARKKLPNDSLSTFKDSSGITLIGPNPMKKNSQEVSVELNHEISQPEVRVCDGPCGQMRTVQDLRVLGRCDHAICAYCIVNAPMLPQDDGTMSCCNKRCFATDLVNRVPERKRRHELYQLIFKNKALDEIYKLYDDDIKRPAISEESSKYKFTASPSVSNQDSVLTESASAVGTSDFDSCGDSVLTGSSVSSTTIDGKYPSEAVLFRLVALDSSYHSTIKRHRFEVELLSTVKVIDALEGLLGASAKNKLLAGGPVRFFFNPDGKTDSFVDATRVFELNPKIHGLFPISKFLSGGSINMIVDFTGKVLKGKRPVFKD